MAAVALRTRSAVRNAPSYCAIVLLAAASLFAHDDERFLDGLRERRLYRLSEMLCRARLAEEKLPAKDRATFTIELIRCHVGQALQTAPEQREPLWKAARDAAAEFERRTPQHPRLLLIRAQDALTLVARGELARQEAEVAPDPAAALATARETLRAAARRLETISDELTREIPLRRRGDAKAEELTADELLALQHNVYFQLARASRNQALCYARQSDDRAAALSRAVDFLAKALTQLTADDPLAARMRIDLGICQRLAGSFAEAEQTLTLVPAEAESLRLATQAELARLKLDQGQPRQALAVLSKSGDVSGRSADWDFAGFETCMALWKRAAADADQPQAEQWRTRAIESVKRIEQLHGPYWGRRADLLLVNAAGTAGSAAGGGDAELVSRAADNLYRKGQTAEAIAAYERAAALAWQAGNKEQSFQLRYKAALVDHTAKRHEAAARRLRRLGCDLSAQPQACDAHLLAAWNAAQAATADAAQTEWYTEILEEHLQFWPEGKTADTARLWLGRVRESQQDWRAAADALAGVSRNHASYAEATQGAARCWDQVLQRAAELKQLDGQLVESAAGVFTARVAALQADPAPPWTTLDRFCVETAARFWLRDAAAQAASAERLLRAALAGTPPPDAAWRTTGQTLLILAVAAQPNRSAEAERLLAGLTGPAAAPLTEVLDGLTRIARSAPPPRQKELAGLQLIVIDRLLPQRAALPPAQQFVLRRLRADALVQANRRADAAAAYAELAREQPDDANLQLAYGELLLNSTEATLLRQALDQWRLIADRAPAQTENWYRAKYSIALALYRLGERKEAALRIRYLQAAPPGLDKTSWQPKFLALLRQCETP